MSYPHHYNHYNRIISNTQVYDYNTLRQKGSSEFKVFRKKPFQETLNNITVEPLMISISFKDELKNFSLEEIRAADYNLINTNPRIYNTMNHNYQCQQNNMPPFFSSNFKPNNVIGNLNNNNPFNSNNNTNNNIQNPFAVNNNNNNTNIINPFANTNNYNNMNNNINNQPQQISNPFAVNNNSNLNWNNQQMNNNNNNQVKFGFVPNQPNIGYNNQNNTNNIFVNNSFVQHAQNIPLSQPIFNNNNNNTNQQYMQQINNPFYINQQNNQTPQQLNIIYPNQLDYMRIHSCPVVPLYTTVGQSQLSKLKEIRSNLIFDLAEIEIKHNENDIGFPTEMPNQKIITNTIQLPKKEEYLNFENNY